MAVINVEKQVDKPSCPSSIDNTIDDISTMEQSVNEICEKLTVTTTLFCAEGAANSLLTHINMHERLLYSEISKYLFSLTEDSVGIFTVNLDTLKDFIFQESDTVFYESEQDRIKLKKVMVKMWDHIHLALYQIEGLKQGDDEFREKFNNSIADVRKEIDTQIYGISGQLIALIAIFTAMTFLIFGGFSSFNNILDSDSIPILKAIILGSIWSIFISDLIFIFMYFITILTDRIGRVSTTSEGLKSFILQSPLIKIVNILLVSIFSLSAWAYFINTHNMWGKCLILLEKCDYTFIIGFLMIITIAILVSFFLLRTPIKNKKLSKRKDA